MDTGDIVRIKTRRPDNPNAYGVVRRKITGVDKPAVSVCRLRPDYKDRIRRSGVMSSGFTTMGYYEEDLEIMEVV